MAGPGWWYYFSVGSVTHMAVVVAFAAAVVAILAGARRLSGSRLLPPLEAAMIAVLAVIAAVIVGQDLLPSNNAFHWLPLQICDITSLVAPLALATRWRPLRALLHYWGLTLSIQGFVYPGVETGPAYFQFWSHFIGHGAIVGAALYDVVVRGFRPTWADFRFIVVANVAYFAAVFPLNVWNGWNYGFLGDHPHAVFDRLGPWPGRVPVLLLLTYGLMAALTVAGGAGVRVRRGWETQGGHPQPQPAMSIAPSRAA